MNWRVTGRKRYKRQERKCSTPCVVKNASGCKTCDHVQDLTSGRTVHYLLPSLPRRCARRSALCRNADAAAAAAAVHARAHTHHKRTFCQSKDHLTRAHHTQRTWSVLGERL